MGGWCDGMMSPTSGCAIWNCVEGMKRWRDWDGVNLTSIEIRFSLHPLLLTSLCLVIQLPWLFSIWTSWQHQKSPEMRHSQYIWLSKWDQVRARAGHHFTFLHIENLKWHPVSTHFPLGNSVGPQLPSLPMWPMAWKSDWASCCRLLWLCDSDRTNRNEESKQKKMN